MPATVATSKRPSATSRSIASARHEGHAEAALDGALRGLLQAELGHDAQVARADAGHAQLALDHRAHAGAVLLHDERQLPQPVERDLRGRRRVARRQQQHDLVAQEGLEHQAAVRALGADDAELELPVEDAVDDRLRVVDAQRDRDVGVLGVEGAEELAAARARPGPVEAPTTSRPESSAASSARPCTSSCSTRQDALRAAVDERGPPPSARPGGRSGRSASARGASRASGWPARRPAA